MLTLSTTDDITRLQLACCDGRVDRWELAGADMRSGEIADLYNVPSLLAVKGWQVLNDSESPHTLDVMGSYPSNWLTGFRAAANGGMDVFFIGGHDNPDGAGIPGGDGFSADDTPGKYTRFGADHPLLSRVPRGCLCSPVRAPASHGNMVSPAHEVLVTSATAIYGRRNSRVTWRRFPLFPH